MESSQLLQTLFLLRPFEFRRISLTTKNEECLLQWFWVVPLYKLHSFIFTSFRLSKLFQNPSKTNRDFGPSQRFRPKVKFVDSNCANQIEIFLQLVSIR